MIDLDNIRAVIVSRLSEFLSVPVIYSNTNETLPDYPFVSYTIRQLLSNHKGTWGEYDDGKVRIPAKQIWSLTFNSDDCKESMDITLKAYDFFQHIGIQDLKDEGIVVQTISDMTNRDTLLTVGYEYRNGFDVTFGLMNETDSTTERVGYIDKADVVLGEKI